jgi:hypothetical protein
MSIEKSILPLKINELVSIISEKKNLDITDAMSYLYVSDFYRRMSDTGSKWWYMSGINLYRELEKEKKKQRIKDKALSREQLFIVYCTETYKNYKSISSNEVHTLFLKYGLYDFLLSNYGVLHTQGEHYIVREIESFIKNRLRK